MKIPHKELQLFVFNLLISSGIDNEEALIIAKIFVWIELIGRHTQGVGRLEAYLKRVKHGLIKSPCNPEVSQKSDTIAIINGNNGFGHYLGHTAMSKAIEIADIHGIGMTGVHHSNHFGASAYYVQMAAENNKIGFAFSNSVPHVAPFGGITAALGTNPIAFSVPNRNKQSILIDFSTSISSGSMVKKNKEEGGDIPEGTVIDKNENGIDNKPPQTPSQEVILPFGGAKGFCLGLMVEILSGVITNSGISHEIASMYKNFERSSNVGHLFLVIDIAKIMSLENYFDRIDTLTNFIKSAEKEKEVDEILMPGETRWRNYEKQLIEGVSLESKIIASLDTLACELNVPVPW